MDIEFGSWVFIYVVYQDVDDVKVALEHRVPPECLEFVYGRFALYDDAESYAAKLRAQPQRAV